MPRVEKKLGEIFPTVDEREWFGASSRVKDAARRKKFDQYNRRYYVVEWANNERPDYLVMGFDAVNLTLGNMKNNRGEIVACSSSLQDDYGSPSGKSRMLICTRGCQVGLDIPGNQLILYLGRSFYPEALSSNKYSVYEHYDFSADQRGTSPSAKYDVASIFTAAVSTLPAIVGRGLSSAFTASVSALGALPGVKQVVNYCQGRPPEPRA